MFETIASRFWRDSSLTDFNTAGVDAAIVHCHTWYSHFGGILAKLNYGLPLVITVHSLEPLRPWKREQLAGGYDFTVWLERTALEMADAVIAVSGKTKKDIERLFHVKPQRLHVIHNGIDLDEYHHVDSTTALVRHKIDPAKPYLLFVGRHAAEGDHPSSARNSIHGSGIPDRAVRGRAGHARDCRGNEIRGG